MTLQSMVGGGIRQSRNNFGAVVVAVAVAAAAVVAVAVLVD